MEDVKEEDKETEKKEEDKETEKKKEDKETEKKEEDKETEKKEEDKETEKKKEDKETEKKEEDKETEKKEEGKETEKKEEDKETEKKKEDKETEKKEEDKETEKKKKEDKETEKKTTEDKETEKKNVVSVFPARISSTPATAVEYPPCESVLQLKEYVAFKHQCFIPEVCILSKDHKELADDAELISPVLCSFKPSKPENPYFWVSVMVAHAAANDLQSIEKAMMIIKEKREFNENTLCGLALLQYLDKPDTKEENVHLLVKAQADINVCDRSSEEDGSLTAVAKAAKKGYTDIVKILYNYGADVHKVDKEGRAPLDHAAREGNFGAAAQLIEIGADVNHADDDGWTALHMACSNGSLEIAELLLKKKSNVNKTYDDGWTAFHVAASGDYVDIMKLLIEHQAHYLAEDERGWTALDAAASKGQVKAIEYLLKDRRMDINRQDTAGCTTLHMAVFDDQDDIIDFLLLCDADPNIGTYKDGTTPLHVACSLGKVKPIRPLAVRGKADLNKSDNKGCSPIHAAALKGHLDVIDAMLNLHMEDRLNIDFDHVDDEGRTALHKASARGHLVIVELLVAIGADVLLKDNNGHCPFHMAAAGEHDDVMKALTNAAPDEIIQMLKDAIPEEGKIKRRSSKKSKKSGGRGSARTSRSSRSSRGSKIWVNVNDIPDSTTGKT